MEQNTIWLEERPGEAGVGGRVGGCWGGAGWLAAMVRIYAHIHVHDRENCSSGMRGGRYGDDDGCMARG